MDKTFSESWYRVANQKICLRPVVKVRRQNFRGERWIILENPFSNQYFRIRPIAYEFVSRLRPDKTVEQVWNECLERFPDTAPSQESVINLLSQLYFRNLLQYDLAADSAQLFERYKKRKQREIGFRFMNIMFARFPLFDPDRFLVRTLPVIGKLISWFGAALWVLVVGFGLKIVVDNFDALRAQGQGIFNNLSSLSSFYYLFNDSFLLFISIVIVKTLHEFGHAYFCRKFGGEVHAMGIQLMVFLPMPYVDATSSWSFRERWKRVLVGSAGMIVEIFFAAIAAFIWARTGPGIAHSIALRIIAVAGVSTVVLNINPLMRLDGYYILSDVLEYPNLSQRAMMQLRHLCERWLFGVKNSESPATTKREAGWLTVFGITSGIYRYFVYIGMLWITVGRYYIAGIIAAAYCFCIWVVMPVVQFVKYLSSDLRLDRVRHRAIGVTAGIVAFVMILLCVVPFPYSFLAPGIVIATQRTEMVNETAGEISQLLVKPGNSVKQGQPLLQLKNPELQLQLADTRAHLEEVNARLLQAMGTSSADIEPLTRLRDSVADELKKLTTDSDNLTVRARHDGIWVAPGIEEFSGRWLSRGSDIGLLANPKSFEFAATVVEEDARNLFGKKINVANVRLYGDAGTKLLVSDCRVIPGGQNVLPSPALGWMAGGEIPVVTDENSQGNKSAEPFFEVVGKLDSQNGVPLLDGRSGKIRFKLAAEPLLPRWTRSLWQHLQKRYQI